ncbi:MAG: hypothetical protein ACI8W9_001703 [Psychromonas sp.]|jgi:hypothetical protein
MIIAKYVYLFTKDQVNGDRSQRELLGGKGANLPARTLQIHLNN